MKLPAHYEIENIAKLIRDADLDDEGDAIRVLFASGHPLPEDDILERAILKARADRRRDRVGSAVGLALIVCAAWFWGVALMSPAHATVRSLPVCGHAVGAPVCPGEKAVAAPQSSRRGDLAIFGIFVAGALAFTWCAFAVSGAHSQREEDDDLAALRRGEMEPTREIFRQ